MKRKKAIIPLRRRLNRVETEMALTLLVHLKYTVSHKRKQVCYLCNEVADFYLLRGKKMQFAKQKIINWFYSYKPSWTMSNYRPWWEYGNSIEERIATNTLKLIFISKLIIKTKRQLKYFKLTKRRCLNSKLKTKDLRFSK